MYSRRVWGTAPSVVSEQADVPSVSGCGEVSAGSPAVAAGGDSSYADVAFQEVLVACGGGAQQTRVLVNRLHGSQYDGAVAADGLSSPGVEGAGDPAVAMTEYGQGFVTSETQVSHSVVAMELGNNGASGGVFQINSFPAAHAARPGAGDRRAVLRSRRLAAGSRQRRPARDPDPLRAARLDPRPRAGGLLARAGRDRRRARAGRRRRCGRRRRDRLGPGHRRLHRDRRRAPLPAPRRGGPAEVAGLFPDRPAGAELGDRRTSAGGRSPTR